MATCPFWRSPVSDVFGLSIKVSKVKAVPAPCATGGQKAAMVPWVGPAAWEDLQPLQTFPRRALPKAWSCANRGFPISSLLSPSLVIVTTFAMGCGSHSQPISGLPVRPSTASRGTTQPHTLCPVAVHPMMTVPDASMGRQPQTRLLLLRSTKPAACPLCLTLG